MSEESQASGEEAAGEVAAEPLEISPQAPPHHVRVNAIVRYSVERQITMAMGVLGLLVLGWLSLTRLPLEFLPAFSSSNIWVNVPYPSASPGEVERELVRPLEDGLGTLNALETLTSSASADGANVNLTFVDGTDMDLAAVEVRDRLDRVRDRLPSDVERIYIRRFQSSDIPVLRTSVSSNWSRERLYDFMEDVVQPRLERLEGVAQVQVRGVQRREIQINLIPARLQASGIDVRQLSAALRQGNLNVSAGYLEEGARRLQVRTLGELTNLQEIRELPIRGDGLTLADVAEVDYTFPERESWDYLNGEESISISINKTSTANLLRVVERAKGEYERLLASPEGQGLSLRHFHDTSVDVSEGLSELTRSGVLGGGLAVLFTLIFLRKLRTTLLIAIAVPLSVVTTFVFIYLLRQADLTEMTLNVMSLMGLMLAVGMLLDNSIVVIESIFRHHDELGEDARTASLRGASEVAMPIICSTATTMSVFLPVLFVGSAGRFGRFMGDIGLTVCIVMAASLLVSLTVVPLVASKLLRSEPPSKPGLLSRMVDAYGWTIALTLRHRFVFTVGAILVLVGSWKLYSGIERTFSPPSEGRQLSLFVDTPRNYSTEQRAEVFDQIYALLDGNREKWEIADIAHEYRRGGGRSRNRHGGSGNRFEIYLVPEEDAQKRASDIQAEIRDALPTLAGVIFKTAAAQHGPPGAGSSQVDVELVGDDLQVLELLAPRITGTLSQVPFLKDVDTSLESGAEELRLQVDAERSVQAGLSTQAVAQTVSSALSSRAVTKYKSDQREIDVVMQYREEDRETLDQLESLPVFGDTPLQLGALVQAERAAGARTIERENRRSKIEISATTVGDMPSFAAMGMVRRTLGGYQLPEGYEWRFARSWRDAEEDADSTMIAFLFAVILVYMIMAALFESFLQPFTILLSIPFAFTGVGLIMKLAGQPRSSTADMGLIILAGIVVNNAIVLVDHINTLRADGMSRDNAVILGGRHRLRPILMTAITTILGLFPMVAPFFLPQVFGQPEGRAAFWAPVGLVILGGLTTSTFLTLLVTPTLYTLVDDFKLFFERVVRSARSVGPRRAARDGEAAAAEPAV
ncbi:MAG: AcrB/AcrD/AcrF family protein [Acidobacteria bacterium]|nr:MAG: AcrB/AcrD/AcrF family protein [Acidobacteriota bacterium]